MSTTVRILQLYGGTLFVIPSVTTIPVIGAVSFPAALVALLAALAWGAWTLLGSHNPLRTRTPTRVAFGAVWVATFGAYISMQSESRTVIEAAAADRWLILLTGLTGVGFLASECLGTLTEVKRVLRALLWGAGFCGAVAAVQYWFRYDLAEVIARAVPGFSAGDVPGIGVRDGFNRVSGTTNHPIELGTTAAMLLPLALYMAIHDRSMAWWKRATPALLIGLCIPISVSRSGVVGVAVALAIFVVLLPARARLVGLAGVPTALAGVFLTLPGIIGTFTSLFTGAPNDSSISARTEDFSLVVDLVGRHPWFGRGGWAYVPPAGFEVLDNAYYKWAIEFGLIGLALLVVFFYLVPMVAAFFARRRAGEGELAILCGALGAAIASAAVSSYTYDAFAYPVFTCVLALIIGLVGACWRLTQPQVFGFGTKG